MASKRRHFRGFVKGEEAAKINKAVVEPGVEEDDIENPLVVVPEVLTNELLNKIRN